MCRRNHLCGCCMISFGLGVLFGKWIPSGFLCFAAGVFFLCVGVCLLRRK